MQKSSTVVLFVLISLVLGGAAYFLGSASTEVVENLGPAFDETAKSEDSRYKGTMSSDQPASSEEPEAVEADRMSVDVGSPEVAAAAASSVGMISGRVVDAGGAPLAGARVIVGGSDPLPLLVDLDSNRGFGRRWSTVSLADGTFTIKGPDPGELRVGATLAGFVPAEHENLALPTDGVLDVGDIPLEVSVVLEGRVIVEGGGGVAGAELFVRDPGGNAWFGSTGTPAAAVSDEAGFFRVDSLAAGPWEIEVKSAEQPNRTFKGRSEQPGEIQSGLQFSLEPGMRITGHVSGALAAELEGLEVSAQSGGSRGGMRRMGQSDVRTAEVQPNGSFVIGGCTPEKNYTISAVQSDSSANPWGRGGQAVTERVEALAGATGVDVPWIGSTGLAFQVVSIVTGKPIENFSVTYGTRWMQPFQVDGEPVLFHEEGRVQLSQLNANPGRGGSAFKIAIEAAGYGSFEREFELSAGDLLAGGVLSLEEAALLSVTVVDAATGLPIEDASVTLSIEGEGSDGGNMFARGGNRGGGANGERRVAKSGADGIASLSSFEGKVGKLVVEHELHTTWTMETLTMPAGAPVAIEARLGVGGKVMVTVLDAVGSPIPGARVDTREPQPDAPADGGSGGGRRAMRARFGGETDAVVANADGIATFRNLEPGRHEFQVAAAGGNPFVVLFNDESGAAPWAGVDVVERGEHELVLRQEPVAILVGRVTENGATLAGAELSLVDGTNPLRGFRFGGVSGPGSGTTDGRGDYALSGIAPGSYQLEISHPGRVMKSMLDVELAAGENHFDVNLSIAIVEGAVRDIEGTPMSGVKVSIRRAEGGSNVRMRGFMMSPNGDSASIDTDGADPSITDADGRYSLRGVETGVDLVVSASAQGMAPAESDSFKVSEGETKTGTDIVAEPAGSITFKLEGLPAGSPGLVTATYVDDDSVEAKNEFTQTGEGSLQSLKPGVWRLSARAMSRGGPSGDSEKTVDVLVHPGQESEVVLEI